MKFTDVSFCYGYCILKLFLFVNNFFQSIEIFLSQLINLALCPNQAFLLKRRLLNININLIKTLYQPNIIHILNKLWITGQQ